MCWLKYKNDQMKSFNEGDVVGVKKDSEYNLICLVKDFI